MSGLCDSLSPLSMGWELHTAHTGEEEEQGHKEGA